MNNRSKLAILTSGLRYLVIAAWLVLVLGGVISYILFPHAFTPTNISTFLLRFHGEIWFLYMLISALRGFTLLPATPLVLAGTILFPDQPFAVLTVSIAGILVSSSMIYAFSEHLGFSSFFERHKPEMTHKIRTKLEHPLGSIFVAGWAFFPLVPTDLVCYVAGTTRMNYFKFIVAIFAGKLILCIGYIFFGGLLLNYIR